jgi:teichuronic acid biosynthesis glycosyltransferase TuaC
VAPRRVFPHLRLWKHLARPRRFLAEWRKWRSDLQHTPTQRELNGVPVYYPRYTAPPKQLFHGLWGFFAYPFLRAQLRALHRERPFDLIHAHYASPCGVIALLAQRWMRVPVALSVHGADVTYTAKQHPLSAAIIRWVFEHVDLIFANSRWTAGEIVRYGGAPDKVRVVYLGGDTSALAREPLVRPTTQEAAPLTLLSVGYLEQRKGHAYVLHALKALIEQGYKLRYVIVGDGAQSEQLHALACELGLTDVVSFEGYKAHADVWSYFAACDIFVLPSWQEAFGVVYIEALSYGKPIIGCAGEGGPEDLRALGDCIELVKPRDVASLTRALQRLLEEPDRRHRMGEIGRAIVAEHFTWERNATETMGYYRQLLEARGVQA